MIKKLKGRRVVLSTTRTEATINGVLEDYDGDWIRLKDAVTVRQLYDYDESSGSREVTQDLPGRIAYVNVANVISVSPAKGGKKKKK